MLILFSAVYDEYYFLILFWLIFKFPSLMIMTEASRALIAATSTESSIDDCAAADDNKNNSVYLAPQCSHQRFVRK